MAIFLRILSDIGNVYHKNISLEGLTGRTNDLHAAEWIRISYDDTKDGICLTKKMLRELIREFSDWANDTIQTPVRTGNKIRIIQGLDDEGRTKESV